MAKHISYGIIGCGMMGQEHLRNIALLPDAHVAAIFEPDAAMRERAAAFAPQARVCRLGRGRGRPPECRLPADRQPQPCAFRATEGDRGYARPADTGREAALCRSGGRGALQAFAASYPAPVWVAMEYRYMPPVARFIEQAEDATGGIRMLTIREHRFPFLDKVGHWNRFNRNSGGTFVEKCCHFFDLMRLILKSEPMRIMASAGQEVNHRDERYDGEAPDIWDCGYVLVDFASGARAMLELCMYAEGSRYQEEISAVGATRQDRMPCAGTRPILAGASGSRADAANHRQSAPPAGTAWDRYPGRPEIARGRRPQWFDLLPASTFLRRCSRRGAGRSDAG